MNMNWQTVWRLGIAPQLPTAGLVALQRALATNDRRLLQGASTMPPPLQCVQDWPCEGACAIGFCCAFTDDVTLKQVSEVEEFFARVCFNCDQILGEPAACRWYLNWFDETPRDEMRAALLVEVDAEIGRRRQATAISEQSVIIKALVRAGRWRGEVQVFARQVPVYEGPERSSQAEALEDAFAWVKSQRTAA
jgi:hypothetical protein